MPRRCGNPKWGRGQPAQPLQLPAQSSNGNYKSWALTHETYASSVQLRTWCVQNRNERYVPEWLVKVSDFRQIQTSAVQPENPAVYLHREDLGDHCKANCFAASWSVA
jgi:hypothetical protein